MSELTLSNARTQTRRVAHSALHVAFWATLAITNPVGLRWFAALILVPELLLLALEIAEPTNV